MRRPSPALLVIAALGGCAAPPPARRLVERPPPAQEPPLVGEARSRAEWSEVTRSPWPASVDAREAALTSACGQADGALARVAAQLVAERARGLGAPDPDRAVSLLRAHGEPHVRPRIVSVSSRGPGDDVVVRARLESAKHEGTRCGVALARPAPSERKDGDELLVAVAVDALADLEALPTRARTGEWLTFTAVLHVPATNAKLVVLGPRGLPRTVPTSIDRATGTVRARFALDRPGAFTVQLIADVAEGPRPLLEARVFADVARFSETESLPAPGEETSAGNDDATTLARMTAALRAGESLPALRRDERLDALARAHAEQMKAGRTVAHDLGEGDLALRFEAAGLAANVVGENVARARSVALVHRALHASPSHRMNLLRADYTHAGVGVVTDDSGDVYACQVFASGLR